MTRLSYDTWRKRFQPLRNIFDDNAGVGGFLFHPYGVEWEFVKSHDPSYIWTLIITDLVRTSVWTIADGIHIVNREGYLVTKIPSNPKYNYSVRY